MGGLLKLIIHALEPVFRVLVELLGAMAKFFTIHFVKTMTVTGILIAVVCVCIFVGTKK